MAPPVVDKEGLLAVLQPLTGLSPNAVYWALDPNPLANATDAATVAFRMRGLAARGVDDRVEVLGTDGVLRTQQIGQRDIRLTAFCQAYDPGVEAGEILDRIRTAILQPDVQLALIAVGIAYQSCSKTMDIPAAVDSRVLNSAAIDLFFGGVATTDLSAPADGTPGWIATVNTSDTVPLSTS